MPNLTTLVPNTTHIESIFTFPAEVFLVDSFIPKCALSHSYVFADATYTCCRFTLTFAHECRLPEFDRCYSYTQN